MTVRDAANQPVSRQRLSVVSDIGTVVPAEVETDGSGRASLLFTAPPSGTVGNSALIRITPIGSAAGGAVARTLTIGLTGPVNGTAPIPDFDITPPNPEENALVSFDASTTTDEGNVPCVDRCTYQWDFGDGSATGRVATHRFVNPGTYTVTLTVTDDVGSSASKAKPLTVSNVPAPTVTLNVVPDPPYAGQNATFTADAKPATGHGITKYVWTFSDGGCPDSC